MMIIRIEIDNGIKYKIVKIEQKVFKLKQFMSALKGEMFRKPCFIGTEKS